MRVKLDVWRERIEDGTRELCVVGHFTLVAVGRDGRPVAVPHARRLAVQRAGARWARPLAAASRLEQLGDRLALADELVVRGGDLRLGELVVLDAGDDLVLAQATVRTGTDAQTPSAKP